MPQGMVAVLIHQHNRAAIAVGAQLQGSGETQGLHGQPEGAEITTCRPAVRFDQHCWQQTHASQVTCAVGDMRQI
jgi:hypothetical protein